jgi:DNA-directed RNA polymerase subunit L
MGYPTQAQTHNALVKGMEKILNRLDEIEKKLEELKDKKDEN